MNPDHWEMEFYEDENGNEPCKDFIEDLATPKKLAIQAALINILARQGPDVCETEFGKPLRDGLYEFRLRHSESGDPHTRASRLGRKDRSGRFSD